MTMRVLISYEAALFGSLGLLAQAVPWQWIGGLSGLIVLAGFVSAVVYKHMHAIGRLDRLEDWRRDHTEWGQSQLAMLNEAAAKRDAQFQKLLEITQQQSLQLARIETALECENDDT